MIDSIVPGLHYTSRAQELWALVIAALAGWEERMNELAAATGLSPVSAWTLVQLDAKHPISQKELAARLKCNPSTVVDPTDRLEEAGLVVRHANPADRRINTLVVTAKGKKVRNDLIARLFEPPEAFRRMPADELSRFRDAMLDVVTAISSPAPRHDRSKPRGA